MRPIPPANHLAANGCCRNRSPFLRIIFAFALLLCAALPALAQKAASQAEPVEISGRVVAGLDKVFIKDAEGYCLVQGIDLAPYSGRNIQAKALVIRKDQEYRTVRLLSYQIQSPDDDSPGADGMARQTTGTGKKKK